jgi:hypothetical protein
MDMPGNGGRNAPAMPRIKERTGILQILSGIPFLERPD